MSLLRQPSFPLNGQPGEAAHMVYLHSFLKSKPAARPWQDWWCIWRERVVESGLQRANIGKQGRGNYRFNSCLCTMQRKAEEI